MEQDRICKIGSGLTAQYKHSASFLGVDVIDMVSLVQSNNRCFHLEKVHSWPRNLGRSRHFCTGKAYFSISVFQ